MKKLRNKAFFRIFIAFVIALVFVLSSMMIFVQRQYGRILNQADQAIEIETEKVAASIETEIENAINNIQITALLLSNTMEDASLNQPQALFASFIEKSPFNTLEYVDQDGTDYLPDGTIIDKASLPFYKDAMKGNTGVWTDFSYTHADEPVLHFYTPLVYENEIVGILVGTLGGNTDLSSILYDTYNQQIVYGFVMDEDENVISSTTPFNKGDQLDEKAIDDEYKDTFMEAISKADGKAVNVGGIYSNSVCVVRNIENTNWKVVEIAPSSSIHGVIQSISKPANRIVGILFVTSVFLFLFVLSQNRKIAKVIIDNALAQRDEQFSIMKAMSDVYYSMHVIDLEKNSIVEYNSQNQVKEEVSKGQNAVITMRNVMKATMADDYLSYGYEFTDLTTLPKRMCNKKVTYTELKGRNVGWIRLSFIALEVNENQEPVKVICTTEIIDAEKKREQALLYKSNTDELTGFLNRRAYEEDALINNYSQNDLVYVSMDVNGLKVINDSLGHAVGDELLRGAAECMKFCFGSYGSVYRIGGDEFVAIIMANEEKLKDIKEDFERTTLEWRSSNIQSLNVSCGYVMKKEYPQASIYELAKIADNRMYKAKADFYKAQGIDRRGQSAAHLALCSLYTKILKINLTKDTFSIINMDLSEQSMEKGYSNRISTWLSNFGMSGHVHPDDLDEYIEKTQLEYLQEYFRSNKTSLSINYRRKIKDGYKYVQMEMIPADDYREDNQSLYLYVKTVDK